MSGLNFNRPAHRYSVAINRSFGPGYVGGVAGLPKTTVRRESIVKAPRFRVLDIKLVCEELLARRRVTTETKEG